MHDKTKVNYLEFVKDIFRDLNEGVMEMLNGIASNFHQGLEFKHTFGNEGEESFTDAEEFNKKLYDFESDLTERAKKKLQAYSTIFFFFASRLAHIDPEQADEYSTDKSFFPDPFMEGTFILTGSKGWKLWPTILGRIIPNHFVVDHGK